MPEAKRKPQVIRSRYAFVPGWTLVLDSLLLNDVQRQEAEIRTLKERLDQLVGNRTGGGAN